MFKIYCMFKMLFMLLFYIKFLVNKTATKTLVIHTGSIRLPVCITSSKFFESLALVTAHAPMGAELDHVGAMFCFNTLAARIAQLQQGCPPVLVAEVHA